MGERLETDVLIVGAGTTGSFLAWRLAEAGYDCIVLEKRPLDSLGVDIGPFHMERVAFERFDVPEPGGEELLHVIEKMTMFSPKLGYQVGFELPTLCMDKPRFIRRLHEYARQAGARILEGAVAVAPVFDRGVLGGLEIEGVDGASGVAARLVIDATGIEGAVRSMMPPTRWFENDPITDEDTIFVYMETWRDMAGDLEDGVMSYPYYQGWCAPGPGDTHIVGIGAGGGFEAARNRHREFVSTLPLTGEVVESTTGRIPYRRPPFSLVDNGLIVVGDAACMNKPFSGEGVASAFAACVIAMDVVQRALDSGDTTRDALWPYNVGYFRSQGSKFAFLTAVMPALVAMGQDAMEFLFSLGLIDAEGARAMQLDYEVKADVAATLGALPSLAAGMVRGQLSPRAMAGVAAAGAGAAAIRWLYERYPENADDFGVWRRAAAALWKPAERRKRRYFSHIMV